MRLIRQSLFIFSSLRMISQTHHVFLKIYLPAVCAVIRKWTSFFTVITIYIIVTQFYRLGRQRQYKWSWIIILTLSLFVEAFNNDLTLLCPWILNKICGIRRTPHSSIKISAFENLPGQCKSRSNFMPCLSGWSQTIHKKVVLSGLTSVSFTTLKFGLNRFFLFHMYEHTKRSQ